MCTFILHDWMLGRNSNNLSDSTLSISLTNLAAVYIIAENVYVNTFSSRKCSICITLNISISLIQGLYFESLHIFSDISAFFLVLVSSSWLAWLSMSYFQGNTAWILELQNYFSSIKITPHIYNFCIILRPTLLLYRLHVYQFGLQFQDYMNCIDCDRIIGLVTNFDRDEECDINR